LAFEVAAVDAAARQTRKVSLFQEAGRILTKGGHHVADQNSGVADVPPVASWISIRRFAIDLAGIDFCRSGTRDRVRQ
jgi:hypothetical protein